MQNLAGCKYSFTLGLGETFFYGGGGGLQGGLQFKTGSSRNSTHLLLLCRPDKCFAVGM